MNSKAHDSNGLPPPSVGFLLNDVARLLRKRFEQHARGLGLTRAQWQVLAYLNRNEGIRQSGLAELLDVEPITLGRIIDKLEASGLVERRAHASDRRLWLLHLTEAARPKLAEISEIGEVTRTEAFESIPEAERERLLGLLSTMKSNLVAACCAPRQEGQASHG